MVQLILVWVSKPTMFKVISLEAELVKILQKQQVSHIDSIILYSLLVDEVNQCSRDIEVLKSVLVYLFVGKIYNFERVSQLNGNWKKETNSGFQLKSNRLTWWKSFNRIRFDKDLGNKRCVAVVNFLLELQLRPRNILGMKQTERPRTATGGCTLMRKKTQCVSQSTKLILV